MKQRTVSSPMITCVRYVVLPDDLNNAATHPPNRTVIASATFIALRKGLMIKLMMTIITYSDQRKLLK